MVDQPTDTVMGRYSLVIQWLPVLRHLARSFDVRPLITIHEQTLRWHYNWSINILNKHYPPGNDDITNICPPMMTLLLPPRAYLRQIHRGNPLSLQLRRTHRHTNPNKHTNTQATRSLLLFNWGEHTQGNTKAHTQANTLAHTNTHRQTNTKTNTQAQTQAHKHIGNPLNCLRRTHNVKSHQNTKI